jgi:hypothetical protein
MLLFGQFIKFTSACLFTWKSLLNYRGLSSIIEVPVWAKAPYGIAALARWLKPNGNEKTILLSLPSHLCDGLVKTSFGFSPKKRYYG